MKRDYEVWLLGTSGAGRRIVIAAGTAFRALRLALETEANWRQICFYAVGTKVNAVMVRVASTGETLRFPVEDNRRSRFSVPNAPNGDPDFYSPREVTP